MKNEVLINMENDKFSGNVLDIGFNNYGIVYNIFKRNNFEVNVEYIDGKEENGLINKNFYDSCVIFFSLSCVWLKINRRKLIKEIYEYLNKDGMLYIYDIDKSYTNTFECTVKVVLPDKSIKRIRLNDGNVLKDSSLKSTLKMLELYFNIVDIKENDGIYCIKAKKNGESKDEGSDNSTERKIHTQQFSGKILKTLHEKLKL